MLTLLTKYLLQNRRVCIPHVGTFEIFQEAPQWNVTEKLLTAPVFKVLYHHSENIPDHQTQYLAAVEHIEREKILKDLDAFGLRLKNRIQKEPFKWDGLGTLSFETAAIKFEPYSITLPGLQPVPAERVIRENINHNVLVGDQQMTSRQIVEALNKPEKKRSLLMIIAWIILLLAIAGIIVYLYLNHFSPASSGLRINTADPSSLHKVLY